MSLFNILVQKNEKYHIYLRLSFCYCVLAAFSLWHVKYCRFK